MMGILTTLLIIKKIKYQIYFFLNNSIQSVNFLCIGKERVCFLNTLVSIKLVLYFQCIKSIYILLNDTMKLSHTLTIQCAIVSYNYTYCAIVSYNCTYCATHLLYIICSFIIRRYMKSNSFKHFVFPIPTHSR